ncbi:MAG TPA: hypothetical protein VJN70_18250 [Gemmatimonadaceae bacterium]|nr:hypothetical protein [Gemmatimonadaceae bacterium]
MTPSASLHALLTGAVDYAGLFPPAALGMREAVSRYAAYRGTTDAWALGRFVVPLTRVQELVAAQREVAVAGQPWRLSVLLGDDPAADAACVRAFNASHAGAVLIDSAEVRLGGPPSAARKSIATMVEHLPPSLRLFIEIPSNGELAEFIAPIAAANVCAKIRTGGVTADAFPEAAHVARFLTSCAEHDVRFKATAGLHHPWRGRYPLTYEQSAPSAVMFGFLNLFVAAALARRGAPLEDIVSVLEAERVSEVQFGDDGVRWNDIRVTRQELLETHATFALSFGSCSFEEPVHDLRQLALL